MSKAKSILDKMENGGFRPGELASLFIQKIGGKQAFVQDMVDEWSHAHRGSAIRKAVLDIIKQDMAKAHEGAMTLEDLDDEALEEIADNAERMVADARLAEGATIATLFPVANAEGPAQEPPPAAETGSAAIAAATEAAAGSQDPVAGAHPGDQRSAEPGGDHARAARAGDAGPLDPPQAPP